MRAAGRLADRGWRRLLLGGCGRRGREYSSIVGKGCRPVVWCGSGAGLSCRIGGDVSFADVSVHRKAYKAASPTLMDRMCVGPCGEGTNRTRHVVPGGGRSAVLGLPLGRFVAVSVSRRVVGNMSSRLVMNVMTKPCNCCC